MLTTRVKQIVSNESGVAMVVCLLIMVVLGVLGVTALMISSIEVDISGNYKKAQGPFYAADGGAELCNCLINRTLDNRQISGVDSNIIKDANFLTEIITYIDDVDVVNNNTQYPDSPNDNPPDIYTTIGLMAVDIDVDRVSETFARKGFAMEFASGYDALGGPLARGGGGIRYRIDSVGRGASNAISNVETIYEYVIGG